MLKAFFLDIAPWIAYGFYVIAPMFQTARLIKRKQSADVSLSFLLTSVLASVILVPRLILVTKDTLLIAGHLASLTAGAVVYIVALYYRKKDSQS